MRQQFFYFVVLMRWQASQHIFQISIRIMPIKRKRSTNPSVLTSDFAR